MTLKKGLLIIALLVTSEMIFIGCSERTSDNFDSQETPVQANLISDYDQIMRREAALNDLDWRWIAAIGYHESRFKNDVKSQVGAVGIMQVMPRVAKSYGVPIDQLADPETNIATAVQIIKRIQSSIRFSESTPDHERLKIILACYNGGIGHIMDARRLAAKHGVNYNSWNELATYVKLKGSPEHVEDEVVRYGKFNGTETVNFVSRVMSKYAEYCNQVAI